MLRLSLLICSVLLCSAATLPADEFTQSIRPQLVQFCGDCHSPEDSEHDVDFLADTTLAQMTQNRAIWKSTAEQLRNRTMPPPDEKQPPEAERLAISRWIDQKLRESACQQGEFAGSITTRRLNRLEYANTIRDLLHVKTKAADDFPVDGSGGEGFDNNGETLFLPPILMERYLEAAREIVDQAIVTPVFDKTIPAPDLLPPQESADGKRKLTAKQTLSTVQQIYFADPYEISLIVTPGQAETRLTLKVDDIEAERFQLKPQENDKQGAASFPRKLKTSLKLSPGIHKITLQNQGPAECTLSRLRIRQKANMSTQEKDRHREIIGFEVGEQPEHPRQAAQEFLAEFTARAFRRPVKDEEIAPFLKLFDRSAARQEPYEESLKLALQGVLISPAFLFRVESVTSSPTPEPINDFELATRLSYFVWSSMPDQELTDLAAAGKLQDEQVLTAQIERMLADDKARAFFEQFTGQWLGTKEVGARVAPDTSKFKGEFTTELLLGFREEPIQLFQYLVNEDRSLLEMITADYVFANKRLAKHYDLVEADKKKISGNGWSASPDLKKDGPFELIQVSDGRRGGILGMGGVHLLTSYPNRTSPVLRGGWVLETLLGIRVPNPPPDIPDLNTKKGKGKTVREQLAAHRENAACAACHNLIDPPGFALDHYDVLGRWRDKEGEHPINATATFPSGETADGLSGLQQILVDRKEEYYRQITRKMLGYALGRSLEDRDDCTINQITDKLLNSNGSAQTLIREIVLSTPFRFRQSTTVDTDSKNSTAQQK